MSEDSSNRSEAPRDAAGETVVVVGVGPGLGPRARGGVRGGRVHGAGGRARRRGGAARIFRAPRRGRCRCVAMRPDADDVERLFAAAAERGTLEIAVFNAGAFEPRNVVDTSPADFERCWRVGCFGGFLVGRSAARLMLGRSRRHDFVYRRDRGVTRRGGFREPRGAEVRVARGRAEHGARARSARHSRCPRDHRRADSLAALRAPARERGPDSLLEPEAIAAAYLDLHRQARTAWTQELDLRPWVERF